MKKNIIANIILFAALSIQVVSVRASEVEREQFDYDFGHYKQEITFHAGGGLSTLTYKISDGKRSNGFGGEFGVSYTHRWTKDYMNHWGIHTGIGLGIYNAKAQLNDDVKTEQLNLRDDEDDIFDLHTTFFNYQETQQLIYLNIPVMLQYRIDWLYAMAGVKVGIPVSGKSKSKDAILTNKADYTGLGITKERVPSQGIGEFKNKGYNGKLDMGFTAMLSAETGVNIHLDKQHKRSLRVGLYFDYGLNDIKQKNKTPAINFDPHNPKKFTANSVLASNSDNTKPSPFTDKVNLIALGVKVRYSFGWK
jgi:hypothetical protein